MGVIYTLNTCEWEFWRESDREVTGSRNVISLFLSAEDGGEEVKSGLI